VFEPYGGDWDEWQLQGLMPISFCPLCGDDNLRGVTSIVKAFSSLNVGITLCADCHSNYRNRLASYEKEKEDFYNQLSEEEKEKYKQLGIDFLEKKPKHSNTGCVILFILIIIVGTLIFYFS